MTVIINYPLNIQLDTNHWGIPRGLPGRDGNLIVGICLHVLEAPVETYMSYLQTPYLESQIRPGEHGSVHYGIEADGTIHQFVLTGNTAWGVQELEDPTWDLLGDYAGIDPDRLFIHVGVERYISAQMPSSAFRSLTQLLATLCVVHNIAVDADHIISHIELEASYTYCDIATGALIGAVANLIASGNTEATANINVLAQQVQALIVQVDALEEEVDGIVADLTPYAAHATVVAQDSVLGHVKSSPTLSVNGSTGAISTKSLLAAYRVDAASPQTVVPSIATILQFPTVVADPYSWATLGVLWNIKVGVDGTYRVQARAQVGTAHWTKGKYIALDLYKNNALYRRLAKHTVEGDLTSVTMDVAGEVQIVSDTVSDKFDIRLTHDDTTSGSPTKQVVDGNVVIERIGA